MSFKFDKSMLARLKAEKQARQGGGGSGGGDEHENLRPTDVRRVESAMGGLGVRYNPILTATSAPGEQPPAPGQTQTGDAYPIARPGLSAAESHRELQAALTFGGGNAMNEYGVPTPARASQFMARQTLSIVDMGAAPRSEPRYHEGRVGLYSYGRREHTVRSTYTIPTAASDHIQGEIAHQTGADGQLTGAGHATLRTMYGVAATRQTINEVIRMAAGGAGTTMRRVFRLRGG